MRGIKGADVYEYFNPLITKQIRQKKIFFFIFEVQDLGKNKRMKRPFPVFRHRRKPARLPSSGFCSLAFFDHDPEIITGILGLVGDGAEHDHHLFVKEDVQQFLLSFQGIDSAGQLA